MDSINMEKFGAFVAELRKVHGLTQKELGEKLFVTDKTVSKWERGLSLPNVALLLPLSEELGVTVTELLRGERTEGETLPVTEVEHLLTSSITLSAEEQRLRKQAWKQERKRWGLLFVLCAAVSAAELLAMLASGYTFEELSSSVFLVMLLLLTFGGWFCFCAPDTLPSYYDENRIDYVASGFFKMHMPGISFNNRNWPHIVNACRKYCLFIPVVFPPAYHLLKLLPFARQSFLPALFATLAASLGIILPVYLAGRRHG